MQQSQLEEAIKSDIATISTMKWGTVSAKEFYGRMFGLPLKLSFLFLALNVLIRIVLMSFGLCPINITVKLILSMWMVCFIISLFFGMMFGHLILISKLIKGRLKTAPLIRKTLKHFSLVFLGLYIVIYALMTYVVSGSWSPYDIDPVTLVLPQGFALVFPVVITSIFLEIEIGRLGLGALFNILSEWISKSKNQNQAIS